MDVKTENYINELLLKSEEAYLMSLEIINKPTIRYRTEGFTFFICNAWELLLKAYLIQKNDSLEVINYKDKTNRTIGLEDCISLIFTSTDNPIRNNLQIVRSIRNKATHIILPDYDFAFSSLFQRCLYNYNDFYKKNFPNNKLNDNVTPFISLAKTSNDYESPLLLDDNASNTLKSLIDSVNNGNETTLNIRLVSTKKESNADLKFKLEQDADKSVSFIEVEKPTDKIYPYSAKELTEKAKESIRMELGEDIKFNITTFTNMCKKYRIKENSRFYSKTKYASSIIQLYSQDALEYVIDEFITEYKRKPKV